MAAALITAAVVLAYANSLSGPFVLDDITSIPENPTLRQGGSLMGALVPPSGGQTAAGRPLLNLSLAANHAISGSEVWSYHLANAAIHLLASLTLLGLVRRLSGSSAFGGAVALVWAVHPLNTESVTYVVQRAESLMGLFYLFAVYGFVRGADKAGGASRDHGVLWLVLSALSCLCGMATKEVMVSAPLMILLVDRNWYSGSFASALRKRKLYYGALAATWVLLSVLVYRTGSRGGTSGFGSGVPVLRYWATQPSAVALYLKLSFWPDPLVFDYGAQWMTRPMSAVWPGLLTAALLLATTYGCARRRTWGLLGLFFFATLAPTSLVPGNRQTAAEHRMYLALIAVVAIGFAAIRVLSSAVERRLAKPRPDRRRRLAPGHLGVIAAALSLALPAVLATRARNLDYASAIGLFGSAAAARPGDAYAQANYGTALLLSGHYPEAVAHLEAALRLDPRLAETEDNLGNALARLGRPAEAESHYRRAIAIDPGFADPHGNLGQLLLGLGRFPEARREAGAAIRIKPDYAEARAILGMVLMRDGRTEAALAEFEAAAKIKPQEAGAHINLGNAFRAAGKPERAAGEYARAAVLEPGNALVHYDWAGALMDLHDAAGAERHLALSVRLDPIDPSARQNLGNVLLAEGKAQDAIAQYEEAVSLAPSRASAHYNLANGFLRLGRRDDAIREFQGALRLDPNLAPAREMLAVLGAGGP